MTAHEMVVFYPFWCHKMGVPHWIITGQARLEHLVPRKIQITIGSTQFDAENTGILLRLVEAIKVNRDRIYAEICRPWRGYCLRPKAVTEILKLPTWKILLVRNLPWTWDKCAQLGVQYLNNKSRITKNINSHKWYLFLLNRNYSAPNTAELKIHAYDIHKKELWIFEWWYSF